MDSQSAAHSGKQGTSEKRYLSLAGAWALAFGCSVGWGAFVMPGSTFLPIAGPAGTALGIALGALVMLILGYNYHYLMNRFSGSGGVYTYTQKCFGYDHGFVSAWFLILTYIAIIWANATALPLIARTLLGGTFQFGFDYTVAGFHIYFGEILLAVASLVLSAFVCLHRKAAERTQILMAALLLGGVVIVFLAAAGRGTAGAETFQPAYAPSRNPLGGVLTIFALTPWAFVGFESISHSTEEAKFPLKKSFAVMAAAVVAAGAAYALLALLAVTALPEGSANWTEYVQNLGSFSGIQSQPTFFAARSALGRAGSILLGLAALGGIVTGLVGNYVALSRLVYAMSADGLLPGWFGGLDRNCVPRRAILCIMAVSVVLPFFGRTAISWIVDVTTVGATIAYAFASAAAWKTARQERDGRAELTGLAGLITSLLFALEFLIPNILSVQTLSTESYLILAAWSILGFLVFRVILIRDRERRYGRSTVAWVILLGLIIFTSSVWMRQSTEVSLEKSVSEVSGFYTEKLEEAGSDATSSATWQGFRYLRETMDRTDRALGRNIAIQMLLIIGALLVLFDINARTQKRERQIEIEKILAEESSRAKSSFLSNMSHEIRTPMNAIIGLDNIALRNPNLPAQTREQLEKIGASAKHLLGLINDILDMSRIESGRMVLKNEEFRFREFLDQINIMINGQCMDKGLHYECRIVGHTADYYWGDDLKLKQVLINILGNSVKFTEAPGDVTLTVEQLDGDPEQGGAENTCTMRFTMRDTGIGMDEEFIPKIFEAFSQEDATSNNRYGGSGLGMAITKNFVEMMGGSIDVKSRKGEGSVFMVTVRLGTSERQAQIGEAISLPEDLRACVVDDDEIACEHAQVVLKAMGVESDAAADGEQALETLRKAWESGRPYGLLVTDCKMPGLNGLGLTKALRSFDAGETAVIMLTGYNWDIIEDEAKEDGVDAILSKPLFTDSLKREIYHALVKRRGGEADGLPAPEEPGAAAARAGAPENSLAGRRILMAEDVAQNAEILEDLLMLEDMEAEHAENGQIAVQMFSEKPAGYYDAILMDVRMPVLDGLSATEAIRALPREDAKRIPIIAMTANVFDEDVERSEEAGMNAHLSKPVEPERLYETLRQQIFTAKS